MSDEDLARVITNGVPDAGMPGFKLQPREVTALIAFIRAGFDVSGAAVKIGDPSRGQSAVRGQGRLRHLPSRQRRRPTHGA